MFVLLVVGELCDSLCTFGIPSLEAGSDRGERGIYIIREWSIFLATPCSLHFVEFRIVLFGADVRGNRVLCGSIS